MILRELISAAMKSADLTDLDTADARNAARTAAVERFLSFNSDDRENVMILDDLISYPEWERA